MSADPLIGTTIGNFHIERLIGRGGMAQVYYGTDIKLQRPVAIKVIASRLRGKKATATRFIKEARVMAQWKHAHIVQIYSADDVSDLYYYVMEFVDGEDLASIMTSFAQDGELLPTADVIRIGRAIASALDYAHAQNVIHRDVKPSNVLVARDGRVMLSDFGLALDLSNGSLGEVFGTAHYISPEQAQRSANAVPQSDIYALGVVLYEILTGVVPFDDPSPATVALQHMTQKPLSPRIFNPELPLAVETVLLKALEKKPEKRYQSAAKLMDALESALKTASKPSARLPLPPLPVDAPTIQRRTVSHDTVAERVASHPRPKELPPVVSVGRSRREQENTRRGMSGLGLAGIVIIGLLLAVLWLDHDALLAKFAPSTRNTQMTMAPSATQALLATDSVSTSAVGAISAGTSTATGTAIVAVVNTPTVFIPASPAPSITLTATSSATPSPAASPLLTSTAAITAGNPFVFYYDVNTFVLVNKSNVSRSVSAFTFERLDGAGNIQDVFYGWRWETPRTRGLNIFPKTCMTILITDDATYLRPPECGRGFFAILYLNRITNAGEIFWTAQQNSLEFRVLWSGDEVGRCEIAAGACELPMP